MAKASVLFPCLVLFLVIFAAGIFFSVLPCRVPLIYSYLYLYDLHVMQKFCENMSICYDETPFVFY